MASGLQDTTIFTFRMSTKTHREISLLFYFAYDILSLFIYCIYLWTV